MNHDHVLYYLIGNSFDLKMIFAPGWERRHTSLAKRAIAKYRK